MPSKEEVLIQAWRAWDEHPGDTYIASRMEDACADLAAELGWSTTQLRIKLTESRRQGKTYQKTIRELLQ